MMRTTGGAAKKRADLNCLLYGSVDIDDGNEKHRRYIQESCCCAYICNHKYIGPPLTKSDLSVKPYVVLAVN